MKRSYSAEEALKLVLPNEAEDEELSSEDEELSSEDEELSSEDEELSSEDDVEFELESDPSDSSCSSDESTESEHMEDTAHSQWNSKNGRIVWSSTHDETLRYCPAKGSLVIGCQASQSEFSSLISDWLELWHIVTLCCVDHASHRRLRALSVGIRRASK
ncbi:hypothetical protein DPX16_19596 [Anabarilius grahami]|uniref:Uncharacterized protein n=1 Tax=Anabarilius grahami TaxID=495550 RepID=A0A3N0Z610_ANAGA|nr:hypothetical protein DPX16_19596 [Anabarilius grahami]